MNGCFLIQEESARNNSVDEDLVDTGNKASEVGATPNPEPILVRQLYAQAEVIAERTIGESRDKLMFIYKYNL